MTEHDWLSANDSDRMFRFLPGRTTPHKYRLAYCTIFRLHWDDLTNRRHDPEHAYVHEEPGPPRFQTGEMRLSTIYRIGRRCRKVVERHLGTSLLETER